MMPGFAMVAAMTSFAKERSESFQVASTILTELFFDAGDEQAAWLSKQPLDKVAAYRQQFLPPPTQAVAATPPSQPCAPAEQT